MRCPNCGSENQGEGCDWCALRAERDALKAQVAEYLSRPLCQACWQRPVGGSKSGKRCDWCADYGVAFTVPPVLVFTSAEERAILKEAIDTWGLEAQMRMLQEEAGELVASVSHFLRGRGGEGFHEELADVWILLDQMLTCDFAIQVHDARRRKLERLKLRLAEAAAHGVGQ